MCFLFIAEANQAIRLHHCFWVQDKQPILLNIHPRTGHEGPGGGVDV